MRDDRSTATPRRRRQFDDDSRSDVDDKTWSTWDSATRGPAPYPEWLVTEPGAIDHELGILKSGKEADVHLVERSVPTGQSCLLAAKRYRASEHRMFHRDAGYLEGRRVRRSRETRAMAARTRFGREVVAQQWAAAEFAALGRLWQAGAPVPYPVQLLGTELLIEFIGSADGVAAPRLAQLRPDPEELAELWRDLVDALVRLAGLGLTHGDLSPYNVLVHQGRPVLIDLPQVVDLVANPQGLEFLDRDVRVITSWFAARGLSADTAEPGALREVLRVEAGLTA